MNLFTQGAWVFKPIFIVVSVLAVLATRYAAVFPPLADDQRHPLLARAEARRAPAFVPDDAGLGWFTRCGGVALAAGFAGLNNALRTTVLGVVVLTVIILGGTTSRIPEVMGIRKVIDDGGGDSSTEEEERAWLRSGRLGRAGAR